MVRLQDIPTVSVTAQVPIEMLMGALQVHHRPIRTALVTQQPLTGIEMDVLSAHLLPQQTVLVTRRQGIKMPMVVTSDLQTVTQTVLEIQRRPIVKVLARQLVLRRAIRILSETQPQNSVAQIRTPVSGVGNSRTYKYFL